MIATALRASVPVASGTLAFHLDKPVGFDFEPGQAIDLVLGDSQRHTFSLANAPYENELVIATRMREGSAYKRVLGELQPGAALCIDGPFGSLALQRERAALLIAGGIGITPFRSMLRQAAHERSAQRVVLLYSNRRPGDAAFLGELQALERERPEAFTLVATMTAMSRTPQPWSGARGPIDETLIAPSMAVLARPICYVVGPPAMAESLIATLSEMGVADADIRIESFYGY